MRMTTNTASSKRANELNGKEWTTLSLSVWRNIRRSKEEQGLGHPAMFPVALVERLIRCYMRPGDGILLDPFVGSGSAVIAARNCQKYGIGIDISGEYLNLARSRLGQNTLFGPSSYRLIHGDALAVLANWTPSTVDLCVTSPPYWDILGRPRSADGKARRDYETKPGNLAGISDYRAFVTALGDVFSAVLVALKPRGYCIVNVMDLRKKDRFYPLHMDLSAELANRGFVLDDVIIWDRSAEYNNLRPLGYPYVFRINKVHEYLIIFAKPAKK